MTCSSSGSCRPRAKASACAKQCETSQRWCSPSLVTHPQRQHELSAEPSSALVKQLVIRVLPGRSYVAPEDRARVSRDDPAIERCAFPVALHLELLKIVGQAPERAGVGQQRQTLRA